jgi:catechol 2,3-dioxygenase-like lactoylglutathione lyase family enzyme
MRQFSRFVIAATAVFGMGQAFAQSGSGHIDLRLSAVGVGTKDYAGSMDFYTKVMGFRPAFSFSPNGKTHNTYFQLSRATFLELQEVAGDPGLTHIHMRTNDLNGVVARLRKAGIPACSDTVKTGCMGEPRTAQPTNERNVLIVDPSGIRIEPTEFSPGSLTEKAVNSWDASWESKNPGTRLLVVGIGVKDYPESENFYEKLMGFPVAFKFTNQDGTRTTKYYQINQDTFLEMQLPAAGAAPGLTHVHMTTGDLNAMIARVQKAGLPLEPRNSSTPKTVTEAGVSGASNVKSANVFDPNGIRLELNELLPDSLTTKAMEAWR